MIATSHPPHVCTTLQRLAKIKISMAKRAAAEKAAAGVQPSSADAASSVQGGPPSGLQGGPTAAPTGPSNRAARRARVKVTWFDGSTSGGVDAGEEYTGLGLGQKRKQQQMDEGRGSCKMSSKRARLVALEEADAKKGTDGGLGVKGIETEEDVRYWMGVIGMDAEPWKDVERGDVDRGLLKALQQKVVLPGPGVFVR